MDPNLPWQGLQAVLIRAQRAIQRAKSLSERYGSDAVAGDDATEAPCAQEPVAANEALKPSSSQSGQQQGCSRDTFDRNTEEGLSSPASSSGVSPARQQLSLPPIKPASERIAQQLATNSDGEQPEESMQQWTPLHEPGAQLSSAQPTSTGSLEATSAQGEHVHSDFRPAPMPLPLPSHPLLAVARRLSLLQQQQNSTLSQLLGLRLEQLRLRQQQLSALQELLRAESASVEGTPLQISAVQQALLLLSQSLEDMDSAAAAITAGGGPSNSGDVAVVAATVSCADARAEDISRMARQLLGVLREYPRRAVHGRGGPTRTHITVRGATEFELEALPISSCDEAHPIFGEPCAICLAHFACEDRLKALPCMHRFHGACVDPWLRIKACCPLCKLSLPNTTVHVVLDANTFEHVATLAHTAPVTVSDSAALPAMPAEPSAPSQSPALRAGDVAGSPDVDQSGVGQAAAVTGGTSPPGPVEESLMTCGALQEGCGDGSSVQGSGEDSRQ